jgi:hypothetical protein
MEEKHGFIKEALRRINAPTPKWFKKLRNISGGVALVAGTILLFPVALPAGLTTVLGYAVAVGTGIAAASQSGEDKNKDNAEGTR